jgi:cysteine-rich repeat protein
VYFRINGVSLDLLTFAGETAPEVAANVAAAIEADPNLMQTGTYALATAATVVASHAMTDREIVELCGDGFVNHPAENCDDGNTLPDDGCDGSCRIEQRLQSRAQQACTNALGKGFAKLFQVQDRANQSCLKAKAKTDASALDCISAENPRVVKALDRLLRDEERRCVDAAPDFGARDATVVADPAIDVSAGFLLRVFGVDLDDALVTQAQDKDAVKCQQGVAKAASRCAKARIKEFSRCKKAGLKDESIQNALDLAACVGDDPKSRIARACDETQGPLARSVLPRKCVAKGVDLSDAFPGCGTDDIGTLASCVAESVECEVCQALGAAEELSASCGSCP